MSSCTGNNLVKRRSIYLPLTYLGEVDSHYYNHRSQFSEEEDALVFSFSFKSKRPLSPSGG